MLEIKQIRKKIENATPFNPVSLQEIFYHFHEKEDFYCTANMLTALRFLYNEVVVAMAESKISVDVIFQHEVRSLISEKFSNEIWNDEDFVKNLPFGAFMGAHTITRICTPCLNIPPIPFEGLLGDEDFVLEKMDEMPPFYYWYWQTYFCYCQEIDEEKLMKLVKLAPKTFLFNLNYSGYEPIGIMGVMTRAYEDSSQKLMTELRNVTTPEIYRTIVEKTIELAPQFKDLPNDPEDAVSLLKKLLEKGVPEVYEKDKTLKETYVVAINRLLEFYSVWGF